MDDAKFDTGKAATHFLHTEGPRGFLLRFALAYAVAGLLLQAVSIWLQGPVYEIYLRAFIENDGDITPYVDEINAASMQANLGSLLLLPASLAMWVVFEAASQRRYIRSEGFRLALGADEGRLAIVGLIWAALLFAGYLALAFGAVIPGVIVGLIAGAAAGFITGGAIFLAGMGVALWLFARLSPAVPMTIRDQQIRFFEAWRLSKGRGAGLAGSYFLLFLVFMLASLAGYAVIIFLGIALVLPGMADGASAGAAIAAMGQPAFWAPMSLVVLALLSLFGIFAHALGGPAAWLVRKSTDVGGAVITHTFD